MRLLLDTHTYLWWLLDSPRLSARAREAIADAGASVAVSAATIWEASIKASLGRLRVDEFDLAAEIAANGFVELPVSAAHGWASGRLPPHHRDPFDRLLIAQARLDQRLLVTDDAAMRRYDVAILDT